MRGVGRTEEENLDDILVSALYTLQTETFVYFIRDFASLLLEGDTLRSFSKCLIWRDKAIERHSEWIIRCNT